MIYDILDIFEKQLDEKGDKIILDSYLLKDGLYVKINKDAEIQYFVFKNDRQEEVKDYCFKDIRGNINTSMYEWFKERDYYSCYLNSNKAFGDKRIHNINYLTLFVKIDSFDPPAKEKQSLIEDAIKEQFENLKTYTKFKKKEEIAALSTLQNEIEDKNRQKDVDYKYSVIQKVLPQIVETAREQKTSNYIKIFFDEYIGKYKEESGYYYAIKIFNTIDSCVNIGNEIYGLSDSNMGLNSKKPYLESKTKINPLPFLIKKEDALKIKKFFDWLKVQDSKEAYPLGLKDLASVFIKRHSKNDEAVIDDFDIIPSKIEKLAEPIYFKNYLGFKTKEGMIEDTTMSFLYELEERVHEIFYNDQLKNNYFGEVYNRLDNSFQNLIYITRAGMVNYFKKFDDRAFYQIIKKHGNDFIIEHILKNREFKAKQSINLKFSLLEHKGEKIMDIKSMKEDIIKRLETSNYEPLKSEEFFYLCGQITKYLISQRSGAQKAEMLEPFLRANNAKRLKENIKNIYFQYSHAISMNFIKFNNAMSMIMAYEGEDKMSEKMDAFLVGALSENLFFMKKEV
jgi:CRISPR-associated protein Csh1